MDGERFDRIARSVATGSRRRLFGALAAGGLAALIGRGEAAAACVKVGKTCGNGTKCCAGAACKQGKCACTQPGHCSGGKVCRKGKCVCDPSIACGRTCPCPEGQACDQGTCAKACDASKCEAPHRIEDTGEWVCRDACTGPGNKCISGTCGCPPEGCTGGQACIDGQCTDLCDPDKCQEPYFDPNSQQWVCLICQGNGGYCIGNDCHNTRKGACINGHCGCPEDADFSCGWNECCAQDDPGCGCQPGEVEMCCGKGSAITCCSDWYCQFGCGGQNWP